MMKPAPPSENNHIAVVILAAGQGKRMKSSLPKVLHLLQGKPLLLHVLETAQSFPVFKIVVVVGHGGEKVKQAAWKGECRFVTQEEQLGTAHAVQQAEGELSGFLGDVLILSGDVPLITPRTIERLIKVHRDSGAVLSLVSAILEKPRGYGRIIRSGGEKKDRVDAIREEKDASEEEKKILEINTGIYCVKSNFLFRNLKRIDRQNEQKEYYLTDLVGLAVRDHQTVVCLQTDDAREVLGINTIEELENLEKSLKSG